MAQLTLVSNPPKRYRYRMPSSARIAVTLYSTHLGVKSLDRAIHYAAEELAAGIGACGGSLGDGTHVQLKVVSATAIPSDAPT